MHAAVNVLKCVQLTVRDALNSALDEEMVRDDSVFIIGEEVRQGLLSMLHLLLPPTACWLH